MKDNNGQFTLESMSQATWYNEWILSKFSKFLHGSILEVGCGIGNFTKILTKYGDVYAGDIEDNYIEKTRNVLKQKDQVGFLDIETGKYFFKSQLFDTVVCLNVLEHIQNDKKALENIYQLLTPAGNLILVVPSNPSLLGNIDISINHFRRYNKSQLVENLQDIGFTVSFSKRFNLIGGIGWWFAGRILGNKKVDKNKIKIFNIIGPIFLFLEKFYEPPIGTSILVIAKK